MKVLFKIAQGRDGSSWMPGLSTSVGLTSDGHSAKTQACEMVTFEKGVLDWALPGRELLVPICSERTGS